MKAQRPLGLVVEGNATSSTVLRLPGLIGEFGPIKAGALRVARRLSNFLRGGYAVNTYEDLQPCRLVLLRVPDATLARIVEELCASTLDLKDISFVLCESWLSAADLAPLELRGALVASLMPVQTPRKRWFVVEGQPSAVRQIRRLLDRDDARTFELRSGSKPLYFAAHLLATAVPAQLYAKAQTALRAAGLKGNPLHELLEEMSREMFRSFSNGARPPWQTSREAVTRSAWLAYLESLRGVHPDTAAAVDHHFGDVPFVWEEPPPAALNARLHSA